MVGKAKTDQWPVLFWCGVAVAEFGAIQPGFGYPWRPTAYAMAALLVALGLLSVKAADLLRSEAARQRLRLATYLAAVLVPVHQLSSTAYVTGLSRTGSLILYGMAAVMAVWHHTTPAPAQGALIVASGLGPARLRQLLSSRADDTVVIYRADRLTPELRDLQAEYGLLVVVGDEHDPRVKERVSASGLRRQVPDIATREVVVAGPRPFRRYVRGALSRLAVPGARIRTADAATRLLRIAPRRVEDTQSV
ncbi:hypothetical protein [Nonomuraea sp. NPDC005501]|uniref:hypothetical protein n=1 Tax=Nonomuraea sp. NPDC005501 TaxID=3156884 RepID=UPI0033BC7E5F